MKRNLIAAAGRRCGCGVALPAHAANIIDEWASVKAPPAPALKPVTVDAKTTALLMLDFMNQNCGKRPRCVATVPAMKKLLAEARAPRRDGGLQLIAGKTTSVPTSSRMSRRWPSEPSVKSGADKFLDTDLEKMLKDKGINTVIMVGTAANGAVLYTASARGDQRDLTSIVPVDGMSSDDPLLPSSSPRGSLANGTGGFGQKVTLTKSDMIKF